MYNELNKHKFKDSIKWTITFIALVLLAVMVVGLCLQLFATDDKYKPAEWFKKPEQDENTNAVISNGESNGIMLASARLLNSQYEENGISPQADSAYTLTATIEPTNATDKKLDWSISFKNPNSTWASGKNVLDYVTVTPTSDGALTANVECKQAFGEQIVVKAVSRSSPNVFATCDVDYVARLLNDNFSMGAFKFDGTQMNFTHSPMYSAYTIMPTVSLQIEILLDDSFVTDTFEDFLFGSTDWTKSDMHYFRDYSLGHPIIDYRDNYILCAFKGFADNFLDLSKIDPMDANMLRRDVNSWALSSMEVCIYNEDGHPIIIKYKTTFTYDNQVVSQKTSIYYPEIDLDSLAVQVGSLSLNSGSLVF